MHNSFIIQVLDNRFEKISRSHQSLLKNFEPEEVHAFRVQMKKLRAFIRLLNAGLPLTVHLNMTEKIKSVYHITGTIRNLQLHKKRITGICEEVSLLLPSAYLQHLQEEENHQRKKAEKAGKNISFGHFKKRLGKQIAENGEIDAAQSFTLQKIARLYVLMALPAHSDDALHEVRKILKDLLYDRIYIGPYLQTIWPEHAETIEPLAQKLGEFQDWFASVQLMNEIGSGLKQQEEKNSLFFIQQEFQRRKEAVRQQILQAFQEIHPEQKMV